jgi:hypothetical protein
MARHRQVSPVAAVDGSYTLSDAPKTYDVVFQPEKIPLRVENRLIWDV